MKLEAWIVSGFLVMGLWISWLAGVATTNARNAAKAQDVTAHAMERWADSMDQHVEAQWADTFAIAVVRPNWTETLTSRARPNITTEEFVTRCRINAEAMTK